MDLKSSPKTCGELNPIWFTLPENFENINEYGDGANDHKPKEFALDWFDFVQIYKEELETPLISEKISEWVDLICGFCLNAANAHTYYTLFIRNPALSSPCSQVASCQ